MKQKAVFLDRDGTINIEKNYLYKINDFEFLPGAIDAMRLLQENDYLLIIITNQSGIAKGYYSEEDFQKLNEWMQQILERVGVHIRAVLFCPHHPNAEVEKYRVACKCRKPKLGLFEKAIERFDIDLDSSFAIGDKIRDCAICETTGCHGFLIENNEKQQTIEAVKAGKVRNVAYAKDLREAAGRIVAEGKARH